MFRALADRDPAWDGVFLVGVRTTGIFCRPVCPARKPLPANVEYFATVQEARSAGYRACRRCRPEEEPGSRPEWAERLLAAVNADPAARWTDEDVRRFGVEPARVRRFFTARYGMTFQGWQRARRLGGALQQINQGEGLMRAGFSAGYESDSGFRDAFKTVFGAPPGQVRGSDHAVVELLPTPIGPLLAAATDQALWFLEFLDRRGIRGQGATLLRRVGMPVLPGTNAILQRTAEQLGEYFAGERRQFDLPLAVVGTPFQEKVWHALLAIPHGETRSYDQIAEAVGKPGASRAVGTANGMNRIAIVVPCHRVIRKDGALSGYGGGVWRKRRLLELEGAGNGELGIGSRE